MASKSLLKRVTGKQIIDAVRAVARFPHIEEVSLGGFTHFIVGQKNSQPEENLEIVADGNTSINPGKCYMTLVVRSTVWSAVQVTSRPASDQARNKAVHNFMREFRRAL